MYSEIDSHPLFLESLASLALSASVMRMMSFSDIYYTVCTISRWSQEKCMRKKL